jgi:hypothetical protein
MRQPTPIVALAILALMLGACSSFAPSSGSSNLEFISNTSGTAVAPDFGLRVYSSDDPNVADIYLTDLPELADPALPFDALDHVSGHIIHIHMFIVPKAGKTPIAFTAANTTITHLILADGALGVYRGAGFLLPKGRPGGPSFGGKMSKATLRPISATSGFADLLSWNEARGSINSLRDDEAARALDARIAALLRRTDLAPVE